MTDNKVISLVGHILIWLSIMAGLFLVSHYNFILFHTIAESFSIVIAFAIFTIAWNSRRQLDNHCLLFLGIAYLFIGGLDFLHTLGFKGMTVFQGPIEGLGAKLWIAARYLQSLSLLIAPFFIARKTKASAILAGYAAVTGLLLLSIFYWRNFPTCLIEGVGVTPFKQASEYIISGILVASIAIFYRYRAGIDRKVFQWIAASIFLTIFSELTLANYIVVYGASNLIGHFFKILAFWFVYLALVETGITRPYNLLFWDLESTEGRYRSLFDQMPYGLAQHKIVSDPTGKPVDYIFLEVNPAFEALTGLNKEDLIGKRVTEALPGIKKDPFDWIGRYSQVALTGEASRFENYSEPLDRWFSVLAYSTEKGYFVTLFDDVTPRKRAEREREIASHEAEVGRQTLEALMKYVPEGITIADAPDLTIRMVSLYGMKLLGGPHERAPIEEVVQNWTVYDADGRTPLPLEEIPLVKAIHKGEAVEGREIVQIDATGRRLPLLCNAAPIRNGQGDIVGGIVAWRDITERKNLEIGLQEAKRAADEASRAKSVFLSNMSHELRTPIAGILGMTELLAKRIDRHDAENLQYVELIRESASSLNELVTEVLDFGKIEAGILDVESEPFDLRREIQILIGAFTVPAQNQANRLEWSIDPDIPESLLGDPMRLGQVLRNLVSNAVKFTRNGRIDLEVALLDRREDAMDLLFTVRDTGPGIPFHEQTRVFDDYYQSKRLTKSHTGTGLGLAITKKIVTAMGGRVWLESVEGRGASFFIQLPFQPAELKTARAAEPEHKETDRPGPEPLHFLVAEDNKINQIYIREMLADMGHRATVAPNGRIALELLTQNHFDVVLMDVQMPEMDGYTAIRHIRNLAPPIKDIPIFALTAFISDEDATQAINAGANGHIPKPLDFNDLSRQLANLGIETDRR